MSVCASTRRFLAGLSSGFPCVAIVATSSLSENNCSSCLSFLFFIFCPVLLIALITNVLLSVVVRRAICRWCRASVVRSRAHVCTVLAARSWSADRALQFRSHGVKWQPLSKAVLTFSHRTGSSDGSPKPPPRLANYHMESAPLPTCTHTCTVHQIHAHAGAGTPATQI